MDNRTKTALLLTTAAVVVIAAVYFIPAKSLALDLVVGVRNAGVIAPIVYFVVYVVAAVLGFSRTVLAIAAGIVFNPVVAFSVVLIAMIASFMCTFMLARFFLADWVTARLEKIPVARKLMAAVEDNGFRMLVIMRTNPFVPGFVNGYGFGLTNIKPMTYLLGSVVGSIPLTLIYLYLGWVGGEAMLRAGGQSEGLQQGTMLLGVGLSVVMLIVITWYGRRVIAAAETPDAGEE